jgi:hypothetical protein
MCEEMLEDVQRAMRNPKRLRDYDTPDYAYAEEEARWSAETNEAARTQLAADLARELAAFSDLEFRWTRSNLIPTRQLNGCCKIALFLSSSPSEKVRRFEGGLNEIEKFERVAQN